MHDTFHRLCEEPDLDSGQLCETQTTQGAQPASTGWPDPSAVSAWTEPALEQFCGQNGTSAARGQGSLSQSYLGYLLPVKHKSPSLRWTASCVPHDCSGTSFHSDTTAGRGDDGRVPQLTAP